jgi:hypothetical protein
MNSGISSEDKNMKLPWKDPTPEEKLKHEITEALRSLAVIHQAHVEQGIPLSKADSLEAQKFLRVIQNGLIHFNLWKNEY